MTCSVAIDSGTATIEGGPTFNLAGLTIRFDLPLCEIAPDAPGVDRSVGLSFTHSGTGAGTGAANLAVMDPSGILPPNNELKLVIATLVVNALRDNPQTEHIILARLITTSPSGLHKPAGWHFYFGKGADGRPFMAMLLSLSRNDTSALPQTLPHVGPPAGHSILTAVSRNVFWDDVIVPALDKSFGHKMAPKTGNQMWFGQWLGRIKTLSDAQWLADPAVTWGNNFSVDFKLTVKTTVIFDIYTDVLFRSSFMISLDPQTQCLKTAEAGTPSVLSQKDVIAALANFFQPDTFIQAARGLSGLLPVVSIGNFVDVAAWFVDWPHLDEVKHTAAVLDDGGDPQFFAN